MLSLQLESKGFLCVTAANVSEARRRLRAEHFDITLSDVNMPGEHGLALAADIKSQYPDTALVLMTGGEKVRIAVEAMKAGASDYLQKPVQIDELVASMGKSVEACRLRRKREHEQRHLQQTVDERTRELSSALAEIQATCDASLAALGTALRYRHHETLEHVQRVTTLSWKIAQALGIHGQELTAIIYGAFLHDIGKIGIPDAILLKPGPLTPEENRIMRTHVEIGYEMLREIPFLRPAAEIVHAHHECFDGSGYPLGLKGEEIPRGARVFAVADTVDAIISDRPYRKARSFEQARKEIVRCAGSQFDSAVVSVFINLPQEFSVPPALASRILLKT
ncbi:MAG: response regulator [Acidobacteria bacterium]|nr:response regulator [Acidobacteriota bacterium]